MNEDELIEAARNAVSDCNWAVGNFASRWTSKFAKGRSDHDFGQLVGLSGDQIYQRRRVWDEFGIRSGEEPLSVLKWSFFYVALNWDDAEKCLLWAAEHEATVAEMRAWRRAQNGEDILQDVEPENEWAAPAVGDVPAAVHLDSIETSVVEDPEMKAKQAPTADYAPFKTGATQPAPTTLDPEIAWKRVAAALVRLEDSIDKPMIDAFPSLPPELRQSVVFGFAELSNTLGDVEE